jgi:two-component system chemotaxis response regulator CheB
MNADHIPRDVVVVGGSAGGVEAFRALLGAFSPSLPAVVAVVFHRSPLSDGMILPILQHATRLPVVEPKEGDAFVHGTVYLAPRDRHLLFQDGAFHRSRGPALHFSRPAIDALFTSAARAHGRRVLGVILSGCGFDGARGCLAIKAAGGLVIAQTPEEASFPFMPMNAIAGDHVDATLPILSIIEAICALAAGQSYEG